MAARRSSRAADGAVIRSRRNGSSMVTRQTDTHRGRQLNRPTVNNDCIAGGLRRAVTKVNLVAQEN